MAKNKRRRGQKGEEPTPLLLAAARLPSKKKDPETSEKPRTKQAKQQTIAPVAEPDEEEPREISEEDDIVDEEEPSVVADQRHQDAVENGALSLENLDFFAVTRVVMQSTEYAVLYLSAGAQLSLAGSLSLLCLHGACVVNGAQLVKGNKVKIAAPAWGAAAVLNVVSDGPKVPATTLHAETAALVRKLLTAATVQPGDACMVALAATDFTYRDVTGLEVAAADVPRHAVHELHEVAEKSRIETSILMHPEFRVMTAYTARALKLPYLSIAPSWEEVAAALLAASKETRDAKAVICGPKGAGKSTCVRYLINRLLSHCPAVAVLDCDVGQPEFGTPGVVALHFVTAPVLDLPHHHVRAPLRSYLIGDVTTKNDPLLFAASVRALSQLYNDVRPALQFQKVVSELSCLAPHERRSLEATLDEISDWHSPTSSSIPLLVNTDGWIRSMGSDVLGAVLDLVNPTILGRIGESSRIPPPLFVTPGGCQAFDLQSGVTVPSRALASELRTLRLVTYFTQHLPSDTKFVVRSGQVLDSDATLARLVASAPVLRIPFHAAKLRTHGPEIQPAMMLAAFNAALVAIIHDAGAPAAAPVQLCCPDSGTLGGQARFALDCVGELSSSATCLGFGIVRAIDVSKQCLYLYTPVHNALFREYEGGIYLVLSELSIPQQFCYFPGAPSHAYFSSDTAGEGAATIRSRGTTIKRKNAQR